MVYTIENPTDGGAIEENKQSPEDDEEMKADNN
jgi:hypothetical protein